MNQQYLSQMLEGLVTSLQLTGASSACWLYLVTVDDSNADSKITSNTLVHSWPYYAVHGHTVIGTDLLGVLRPRSIRLDS